MKITFGIVMFALAGIILPVYANVVGPDGRSTCDMIQSSIDSGEENPWITNYILENPD